MPGKQIDCTCTLMWLQYFNFIYEPTNMTLFTHYNINLMDTILYNDYTSYEYCNLLKKCDFERLFNKCKVNAEIRSDFNFWNDVDILFIIKWLQFILLTLLQPILASIGIINNLIIIYVVRNKNKPKEFKGSMYKHIQINAVFNILYCGILLLKLINTCLFYNSQLFCSSVYQTHSSQYFKIVVIFYLGNIMKTCSNVTYLGFSLSRFILVSMNKDNKLYIKFNKMNLKVYFCIIFLSSCVSSSFLLFQYKLNREINYSKEFPYEIRNEYFCSFEINKLQCSLFNALKIINSILTSVICVALNVIIDVSLLRDYGIDIRKKLQMDFNRNKIEELKLKKKKVSKMVLVYGLIFFVSHVPEFFTTILLIGFAEKIKHFCNQKLSCDLINEEAEFFNLISIVCNLFIFRKFDSNFKDSWRDLFNRNILGVLKFKKYKK